jgi:hypothetical protein
MVKIRLERNLVSGPNVVQTPRHSTLDIHFEGKREKFTSPRTIKEEQFPTEKRKRNPKAKMKVQLCPILNQHGL